MNRSDLPLFWVVALRLTSPVACSLSQLELQLCPWLTTRNRNPWQLILDKSGMWNHPLLCQGTEILELFVTEAQHILTYTSYYQFVTMPQNQASPASEHPSSLSVKWGHPYPTLLHFWTDCSARCKTVEWQKWVLKLSTNHPLRSPGSTSYSSIENCVCWCLSQVFIFPYMEVTNVSLLLCWHQ